MARLVVGALGLALCCGATAGATSYLPVTFSELVTRADVIFAGEVVDVRPFPLETREGTIIKTRVVFQVSDPIWGTSGSLEIFEFLGGEWGGIGMAVAEMPQFAVGDRRVVFARRDRSINPIVGFTQGLLQIGRDSAGVDRIFTADGTPIAQPESIGSGVAGSSLPRTAAMRLSDFRERVRRAIAEAQRR